MRTSVLLTAAVAVAAIVLVPTASGTVVKAQLFHDGDIVGTSAVPANVPPGSGLDPIYTVTNGVANQLGIAGVAPGDGPYHGGRWAVYLVTFSVTPYLLTSDEAVMAAEAAGDVSVVRSPGDDNRCPITKKK